MDELLKKQCRTCFNPLPPRPVSGSFCSYKCSKERFRFIGYVKNELGQHLFTNRIQLHKLKMQQTHTYSIIYL